MKKKKMKKTFGCISFCRSVNSQKSKVLDPALFFILIHNFLVPLGSSVSNCSLMFFSFFEAKLGRAQ